MRDLTRRLLRTTVLLALVAAVAAQEWSPALTEVWQPEPRVVTPGDGSTPPSDAIVLFDGTSLDAWQAARDGSWPEWRLENGAMTVVPKSGDIRTRDVFGSVQLHIEWRTPAVVQGEGQGRGNSGVFLQGRYEVQVLDSYQNRTYSNGQAAAVYKQHIPMVNASRRPGAWQTYDIFYRAPVFRADGTLVRKASVTVVHNGVLVQFGAEIQGPMTYRGLPRYEPHGDEPVLLQDHDNPVSFRNIWVRRL
jgi:hypothetical protein